MPRQGPKRCHQPGWLQGPRPVEKATNFKIRVRAGPSCKIFVKTHDTVFNVNTRARMRDGAMRTSIRLNCCKPCLASRDSAWMGWRSKPGIRLSFWSIYPGLSSGNSTLWPIMIGNFPVFFEMIDLSLLISDTLAWPGVFLSYSASQFRCASKCLAHSLCSCCTKRIRHVRFLPFRWSKSSLW